MEPTVRPTCLARLRSRGAPLLDQRAMRTEAPGDQCSTKVHSKLGSQGAQGSTHVHRKLRSQDVHCSTQMYFRLRPQGAPFWSANLDDGA